MSSKESIRGGTEGDSKVFKSSNGFKGYGLSWSSYQFSSTQLPKLVSNVTSNVNQCIQTRFAKLKMEDDLIFSVNGR